MLEELNKQQLILRDIVCQHMDEYRGREEELLKTWRHYNVEHLVEEAMSRVGGYDRIDANYYDHSDYSETKTASIQVEFNKGRGAKHTAVITGVVSDAGQPKVGDLRVVLYNPCFDRLDYYFMPKAGWNTVREYGDANSNKLRAAYNPCHNVVHKWTQWRVKDFETLAKSPSTVTSIPQNLQHIPKLAWDEPTALFLDLFSEE